MSLTKLLVKEIYSPHVKQQKWLDLVHGQYGDPTK